MAHKVAPMLAPEAAQAAAEAPAAVHGAPETAQVQMKVAVGVLSTHALQPDVHAASRLDHFVRCPCKRTAFLASCNPANGSALLLPALQQSRELLERLKRMDAFDTQNFDCTVRTYFIQSPSPEVGHPADR